MQDHQAHAKIKHAIFPKDPMQFREMVMGMWVFYHVVFGVTHPLTIVYEKFAKNVDSIAQKMGVSKQDRALKRFLFGIYSRIDRYFERLVRSGTNPEENLPDLGTMWKLATMEEAYLQVSRRIHHHRCRRTFLGG